MRKFRHPWGGDSVEESLGHWTLPGRWLTKWADDSPGVYRWALKGNEEYWAEVLPFGVEPIELIDVDGDPGLLVRLHYGQTSRELTLPYEFLIGGGRSTLRAQQVPLTPSEVAPLRDFAVAVQRSGRLPTRSVTAQLGWHQGGHLVLGQTVDPDPETPQYVPPDDPSLSWMSAYGSLTPAVQDPSAFAVARGQWLEIVEEGLERVPAVAAALGHAAASVLLSRLTVPSPGAILHLAGTSSGGKSTILRIAAAAWGDPDLLVRTWDQTAAGTEAVLAHLRHVPAFFDELKLAGERAGDAIFQLTGGKSRQRAGIWAQRASEGWRLNLLSTGEIYLHNRTGEAGTRARVLTLGTAMPDAETANRMHAQALGAYGVPAVLLARAARTRLHRIWGVIEDRVRELEGLLRAAVPTKEAILGRKRQHWALAAAGLEFLLEELRSEQATSDRDRIVQLFAALVRDDDVLLAQSVTEADRLLDALEADYQRRPDLYLTVPSKETQRCPRGLRGFIRCPGGAGEPGMFLFPEVLGAIAKKIGIVDVEVVLAKLHRDEALVKPEPSRHRTQLKVNVHGLDRNVKVYGFAWRLLSTLAADTSEAETAAG